MMRITLFLLAALVCTLTSAALIEESEDAKLLVVKNILNNYVVQDLDITIKYTIFNIGNVPALNVKLTDKNFPADKFEYMTGFSEVKWPKISPAGNLSHIAVVRAKIIGAYNFTSATVSYITNEKSAKTQLGYSTEAGEIVIQRIKDYNRKFASHAIDWVMFAIMAAPSILFPYFLWYNSKKRYETPKALKTKSN